MNNKLTFAIIGLLAVITISCNQSQCNQKTVEAPDKVKEVMTKETQDQLTPEAALKDLLEGNQRFVSGNMIERDLSAQVVATTKGQYPKAVILACIDSRVPVEYIFDQGVGDVFVARVAGNIEDEELLGSMEYGLAVAKSKLLIILGHENCGAVKSAIKKVDVGSENVTILLNEIEPAIQKTKGERDASNKDYFYNVVVNNVHHTVADIRKRSKLISDLEKEGKIKVVGAYYSLTDGKVTILDEEHSH